MKILNAIFVDREKTGVKVHRENGSIEVINYELNKNELEENGYTEYEIERNTHSFYSAEATAREGYEKYLLGINVLEDVKSILTREFSSDELFEMKLAAFELDSVKESTDRKLKIFLRKSKNIFELFHYIYMISNSEEEVSEEKAKTRKRTPKTSIQDSEK